MTERPQHARETFPPEEPTTSVRPRLSWRGTSRGDIVGNAPALLEALRVVDRIAPSTCTVLVTGESGTGKESIVGALHDASPRHGAPIVPVNCGAIPGELAEAELFGHARGAFTGAVGHRKGYLASAEGGTLFLDEVGELSPSAQIKLLRVLQQKEYVPVGESRPIPCDIRVVAATNRDLEDEVRRGRFREDLYFRLNVVHVHLPPLRERMSDIPLLAEYFLGRSRRSSQRWDLVGYAPDAMQALCASAWPGNIRALANCIERAVWTGDGPYIQQRDLVTPKRTSAAFESAVRKRLSEAPRSRSEAPQVRVQDATTQTPAERWRRSSSAFPALLPESGLNMTQATERYQNHLIEQALLRTGGNKNRAAVLLGINRTTLSEIIRRRGIRT